MTYKFLLKKYLANFKEMMHKLNYLKDLKTGNPIEYRKLAYAVNELYEKTEKDFKGTIMLPISQFYDARLATSDGECLGYFNQWALGILQNKNPFGISMNQPPPFKPIKLSSAVGVEHSPLNHLAILTKNIANHQQADPKEMKKVKKYLHFFLKQPLFQKNY